MDNQVYVITAEKVDGEYSYYLSSRERLIDNIQNTLDGFELLKVDKLEDYNVHQKSYILKRMREEFRDYEETENMQPKDFIDF
jgi:hypothetical protein